jgi:hypothetical protein
LLKINTKKKAKKNQKNHKPMFPTSAIILPTSVWPQSLRIRRSFSDHFQEGTGEKGVDLLGHPMTNFEEKKKNKQKALSGLYDEKFSSFAIGSPLRSPGLRRAPS